MGARHRTASALRLVLALLVACGLGAAIPTVAAFVLAALCFVAPVVGRVWAQETSRATPRWIPHLLVAAFGLLAGRMWVWWGLAGAVVGVVVVMVAFVLVLMSVDGFG